MPIHWSDLVNRSDASPARSQLLASRPAAPVTSTATAGGRRNPAAERERHLREAQQQNPHFQELLRQREQLQQRMHQAMSGGQPGIDARDAARFQVPTMAERRAEHRAWEAQRDRDRPASPDQTVHPVGRQIADLGRSRSGILAGLPNLPLRTSAGERGGGSPLDPSQWMAQRDRRDTAAVSSDYDRLDQRLGRARSQASGLTNPLRDLDRQFDEADRKMADQGLDSERRELGAMRSEMGLDQFNRPASQADDIFSRFRSTTDRTRDAGERVEQNWLSRRDAIGGLDIESYIRPYNAMKDRVLGMSTADFAERSNRSRDAALDRVRQRRQEHTADETRRSRAIERRRARQDAG